MSTLVLTICTELCLHSISQQKICNHSRVYTFIYNWDSFRENDTLNTIIHTKLQSQNQSLQSVILLGPGTSLQKSKILAQHVLATILQ